MYRRIMDSKTIFLNACHAVADQLDGFERYQKGQRLKKNSSDKDLFFEITFQSSFMNNSSHVMMSIDIAIYSKRLKKWQQERISSFSTGLIYGNHLGYVTPLKTWKKWNLAGLSFENSVNEIVSTIQQYVLPVFERFSSKENAIEFLRNHGTRFTPYCEDSLDPIDFLLCCSDQETSGIFFNNFLRRCSYKGKIVSLYEKLKTQKEINLHYSEFADAAKVKLAYVNNLLITN